MILGSLIVRFAYLDSSQLAWHFEDSLGALKPDPEMGPLSACQARGTPKFVVLLGSTLNQPEEA